MKKQAPIIIFTIVVLQLAAGSVFAQNALGNNGLRINFNEEKTHWVKFSSFVQLWGRVNDNNPGSTINDRQENITRDISIRRFRLGLGARPVDDLYVFFQLGVNNLNYLSPRGTAIDLLDAYVQYEFAREIGVGGGKSFWNGLSRFTSPSTSKLMGYDLNFVSSPTLDSTDDLIRRLSVYTKGKIGSIDYRFVLAKPLSVQNSASYRPEPVEGLARFTDTRPNLQYSGYVKYEFWQPESNLSPAQVGTYLGTKKVLNLGAGFTFQPDALWSLQQGVEEYNDMNLYAMDLFMDLPLHSDKKTAFTAYLGYFNFDFGPNYIRLLGANNPANGVDTAVGTFNGRGNTFPISGTGTSTFAQIGYLFDSMGKNKDQGQLQPYVAGQYSNFDGLTDTMFYYDLGINWYMNGHLSKFTLNAENRPIFDDTGNGLQSVDRKWMLVLQYQFRID